MLKVLLLICPMSLDHELCTERTALDVVRAMKVSTPQQCGFMGQAMLGPSALVPDPRTQYLKIVCVREQEAKR